MNLRIINNTLLALTVAFLFADVCFPCDADSLKIDSLLRRSTETAFLTGNGRIMYFAKSFIGTPYKGGTLDGGQNENLIVRTDSMDCTTYVETVLALYLSSVSKECTGYKEFKDALKLIRYRNGDIDGYVSRLHYFSDWVADNSRKGVLREVTCENYHETRRLSLNYMTTHSDLYKQLRRDTSLISGMKYVEKRWTDYEMPYIPKECLKSDVLKFDIKDGDIIALTTNIKGLDVLHLGFAIWIDGELHLLNASSLHGKVLIDSLSLYDYLKDRRKHTGIRVIRVN